MRNFYIGWWNLENLFDSVRSEQRPEWLQNKLKKELAGWTTTVLNKKLQQLSKVIMKMNDGNGPDILGVCEAENRTVLDKLLATLDTDRNYQVAHHDMSDQRGIDVAFIYDADLFTEDQQFHYVVLKRNATRDIFQVNFTTPEGAELICIGNHWPSRSGGTYESQPYRQMAGETLAYWCERIRDIKGPDVPVIIMGDFNDEPFDSSISHYALGERDDRRVKSKRSRNPYLYNLMWPLMGRGQGTHYYNEWGMLDQILVNRGLIAGNGPFSFIPDSIEILTYPECLKGGKPRRFGRPSSKLDEEGFSDHLPVGCRLRSVK